MDTPAFTAPIAAGRAKDTRNGSRIACTSCRRAKMKCNPGTAAAPCVRCVRKQFSCVYEKHHRGRRPGSSKPRVRVHSPVKSSVPPLLSVGDGSNPPTPEDRPGILQTASIDADSELQHSSELVTSYHQDNSLDNVSARSLASFKVGNKVDALAPSQLLNTHTITGNFCVQDILEPDSSSEVGISVSSERFRSGLTQELHDPIAKGLINLPAAMQLFDSFFKYMLPYIIHLDPLLHTFEYVQQNSPFLLVAILSAAAKIFNPELYPKLYQYSEELLAKTFVSGEKSVEVVQAVLMKTYWKEPDDSRVWQLVGYAGRMCVELCGGKARKSQHPDHLLADSEYELRKQRNLERTWLTLFVYDRSVSLQVGKAWMLREDKLIRSTEAWYNHDMKMSQNDGILAAFVQLRLIGSDMLDLLDFEISSKQDLREISLNLLDTELDKWEERWNELFKTVKLEPCHDFLFKFYGLHFRLYVNSLRLQGVLISSGNIARKALFSSYSSAKMMLEAIVEILGPAKLLYFAQDSIHVMTAYAAIFLTKLLLSLPDALPDSSETTITDLLSTTSRAFSEQCVTAKTSCAYQARFLRNVVTQYWKSKRTATENSLQNSRAHSQPSNPQTLHGHLGSLTQAAVQVAYNPRERASDQDSNIYLIHRDLNAEYRDPAGESRRSPSFSGGHMRGPDVSSVPPLQPNIFEPDIWEGLFVEAGFNIDDGGLMSSLSGFF